MIFEKASLSAMGTQYEAACQYDDAKSYEAGSSFKNLNNRQHKLAMPAATQKNIPYQGNR